MSNAGVQWLQPIGQDCEAEDIVQHRFAGLLFEVRKPDLRKRGSQASRSIVDPDSQPSQRAKEDITAKFTYSVGFDLRIATLASEYPLGGVVNTFLLFKRTED
jgi:hypothetical protein